MKSLCKLAFSAALSVFAFSLVSAPASAQSARGTFALTREVRWQNANVPAGQYEFTLATKGPSQLMTLRKIDGQRVGFMFLVNNTASISSGSLDRLVLVSREGKSFVQMMELPHFGITMNFAVPPETTAVALAGDQPVPTRLR